MFEVIRAKVSRAVVLGLMFTLSPVAQATASGPSISGFTSYERSASVNGVSASLSVNVFPDGRAALGVTFASTSASTYPVGCLNAYKDLRYELRDPSGQVVPANPGALAHPPIDAPAVSMHAVSRKYRQGAENCYAAVPHINDRGADLQALYPHLRRGTYTLYVTFAPRGMNGATAVMAPVPINVPADF
jgi:hypothetical protein